MFNGAVDGGYAAAVAGQPATVAAAAYHRSAVATPVDVHYPVIGGSGGGGVYASCVDDLYGYNKDLIVGGGGGPPDLSHQYYDHGIC